jgi:hypothetical protein
MIDLRVSKKTRSPMPSGVTEPVLCGLHHRYVRT